MKTVRQYVVMAEAGSGITFLLNTLKAFLISQDQCLLFTASTSIAATQLSGRTVHSAFAICQNGDNHISNLRIANRQGAAMSKVQFLFVDKYPCSMGRSST
jgi:NifU-like protein involved in Fe-S cluster formation